MESLLQDNTINILDRNTHPETGVQ